MPSYMTRRQYSEKIRKRMVSYEICIEDSVSSLFYFVEYWGGYIIMRLKEIGIGVGCKIIRTKKLELNRF